METITKWIYGGNKNIGAKTMFWNLCSSIEYSVQSAILLLIVTRVNGLYEAGVFSIAYTFTQMIATIGNYGMRSFQVSDIKKEYQFSTYYTSRIVSTVAMIVICISYTIIRGYDLEKTAIVLALCGYRVVDNIEDVFHGEMQKSMRLDVASKIVSVRILLATVFFSITYIFTRDLLVSSIVLTTSAFVISMILNKLVMYDFNDITLRINTHHMVKLLWVCLPVCAGDFLYNYLVNAPKYAINRNLSEETQTIFSILFIPIFVINLLSSFIFKPLIVSMGILWNNKEKTKFIKVIGKQILIILLITLVIMVGGAVIGLKLLSIIYGVELMQYRLLFTIMLMFGGIAAIVSFLVVVLTIIRQQKFIILAYAIGVVIDLLLIDGMVNNYGIWGAGIIYGLSIGTIMIILLFIVIGTIFRKEDNDNDRLIKKGVS